MSQTQLVKKGTVHLSCSVCTGHMQAFLPRPLCTADPSKKLQPLSCGVRLPSCSGSLALYSQYGFSELFFDLGSESYYMLRLKKKKVLHDDLWLQSSVSVPNKWLVIQCESHVGKEGTMSNLNIGSWKGKILPWETQGLDRREKERQSPRPQDENKCVLESHQWDLSGGVMLSSLDLWMCTYRTCVWLGLKKQSVRCHNGICFSWFLSPAHTPSFLCVLPSPVSFPPSYHTGPSTILSFLWHLFLWPLRLLSSF